jgi:hypothetical protein
MSRNNRMGRKRTSRDRLIARIEPLQTFLIVCEGERTEPNYFRAFRVPADVRVSIIGEGYNTLSLVRRAEELAKEQSYDQVWCVFDRDAFPPDAFNEALALARRRRFHVAYSNEAFELWYLLHFHYYDTGITRGEYMTHLSNLLGRPYHKNDTQIYSMLLPRQPDAIRHAKHLLAQFYPPNPVRDNPSTTVHCLVEELNKFNPEALFTALRIE